MSQSTITSKGQVTVPKTVRDALQLHTGDAVSFQVRADGVAEIRPINTDVLALCGILKSAKKVSLAEMEQAIRKAGGKQ